MEAYTKICILQIIILFGTVFAAHMRIMIEDAQVRSFNKDIASNVTFHVTRENNTMVGLHYFMNLKRDINDGQVNIKYDALIDGEYVYTDGLEFTFPFCDLYTDGINVFKPCMTDGVRGNFPETCTNGVMKKHDYFINNCYFDESVNLTLFLPGQWRINVYFYEADGADICTLYLFMNCTEVA